MKKSESQYHYEPRFLRLRLPRACVAITGASANELIEKAEVLSLDNNFLEFRLDYVAKPLTVIPKLKLFLEQHRQIIAIATCRRAVNGGNFRGSADSQYEVLLKAAQSLFHIVDVEIESLEHWKPADIEKLRKAAALLVSQHDFKQTKHIEQMYQRIQASGVPADLVKVVTMARSLSDNVQMMRFLESASDKQTMIGLCMGEQGIISRVLGVRAGSAFTFGAGFPGEETAPGQITVKTLRSVYRIDQVDAATKVYGVAGDPIAHSLSPVMMNAAFRRENINAVYLALHAKKLDDLLTCIRDVPISGVSVTMPYKQQIIEHLDNSDPITAKIGACNTVIRSADGKLYGFNTDVAGVVRPLEARMDLHGARILVLGAGGAARAAVFGLKERGADVFVFNRTSATGQKLARQAGAKSIAKSNLAKSAFDVIVNATPVGMDGKSKILDVKEMNAKYYFEMIYAPADTPQVQLARTKGMHVILGSEMFVHQGARQFEIWTGKPAPFDEMHRVVLHVVQQMQTAATAAAKPRNGKSNARTTSR